MTPITEDWLRSCGFKWEQMERQPSKHWILWLAQACVEPEGCGHNDSSDLGIELAHGGHLGDWWYCWIRADYAGRYSRFLHVRHLVNQDDLVRLILALTGREFFDPHDVLYGVLRSPEVAAMLRAESERLRPPPGSGLGAACLC